MKGPGPDCRAAKTGNVVLARKDHAQAVDDQAAANLELALKSAEKSKAQTARIAGEEKAAKSAAGRSLQESADADRKRAAEASKKAAEGADRELADALKGVAEADRGYGGAMEAAVAALNRRNQAKWDKELKSSFAPTRAEAERRLEAAEEALLKADAGVVVAREARQAAAKKAAAPAVGETDWKARKNLRTFWTSRVAADEEKAKATYGPWAEEAAQDREFTAALREHTGGGSALNALLRRGEVEGDGAEAAKRFEALDRRIREAPAPPDGLFVYRKVDLEGTSEEFRRMVAGLKAGDVEEFRGIGSASLSPSAYEAPASSLFMEIRPAGGAFTEMVVPGAKDFMLRPNVKLRFVGTSKRRIDRSMWPKSAGPAPALDKDLPRVVVHLFEEVPETPAEKKALSGGALAYAKRTFGEVTEKPAEKPVPAEKTAAKPAPVAAKEQPAEKKPPPAPAPPVPREQKDLAALEKRWAEEEGSRREWEALGRSPMVKELDEAELSKHYGGWMGGLTKKEAADLKDYTRLPAINWALRGSAGLQPKERKEYAQQAGRLEAVLDRAPAPAKGTFVWREVDMEGVPAGFREFLNGAKKGDVSRFDGFMSATVDLGKYSEQRLWGPAYWMEIKPRRGAYVSPHSAHGEEAEFLMPAGSYLRYVGKREVTYPRKGGKTSKPLLVHQWEEVVPETKAEAAALERVVEGQRTAWLKKEDGGEVVAARRVLAERIAAGAKADAERVHGERVAKAAAKKKAAEEAAMKPTAGALSALEERWRQDQASRAAWARVNAKAEVDGTPDGELREKYAAWIRGLTREERKDVYDYTDTVIPSRALRGGYHENAEVRREGARHAGRLDAVLLRAPSPPPGMMVYRQMHRDEMPPVMLRTLDGVEPGDVLRFDGFQSATSNPPRYKSWMVGKEADAYRMEIRPHQGAFVDPLSAYQGEEAEFLMPSNTYLRYIGKRQVRYRNADGGYSKLVTTYQWEQVVPRNAAEAKTLKESVAKAQRDRMADATQEELYWAEDAVAAEMERAEAQAAAEKAYKKRK